MSTRLDGLSRVLRKEEQVRNIFCMRNAIILSAGLVGAVLTLAPALKADDIGATGIVKERRELMEINKDAAGALFGIVSGQADFDAAVVKSHAQAVAGTGGETMTAMFPEDSFIQPTEALPTIWENWDEFAALSDDLVTNAQALEAAADEGADAVQAAFSTLGETCNACHTKFRVPQD